MKYIAETAFLCFVIFLISSCAVYKSGDLSISTDINWVKFSWRGDFIDLHYYKKSYITLPFTIEGSNMQFGAQFDLGSNTSMLYENSLKSSAFNKETAKLRLDTTVSRLVNGNQFPCIITDFRLGNVSFNGGQFALYKNYGTKYFNKNIGTIGSDLFQNKILIIDYPNEKIAILDSLPDRIKANTTFVNSDLDKEGRMLIPINIDDRVEKILFDTGSSLFNLVTDMGNWETMCNEKAIVKTMKINSWGKQKLFYGAKINSNVKIGNKNISGKIAFGDPNYSNNKNFFGITGNSLFVNDVIVLDYKSKKFGILNSFETNQVNDEDSNIYKK